MYVSAGKVFTPWNQQLSDSLYLSSLVYLVSKVHYCLCFNSTYVRVLLIPIVNEWGQHSSYYIIQISFDCSVFTLYEHLSYSLHVLLCVNRLSDWVSFNIVDIIVNIQENVFIVIAFIIHFGTSTIAKDNP